MSTSSEARIARLERRNEKLAALLEVAKAMTAEHHLDALLDIILRESVRTVDAERGSLFIMNRAGDELWSKIAHGMEEEIIRLPVGHGIAGNVAESGTLLNIVDAYADDRFNRAIDESTGYRTNTILCAPMLGQAGNVVGVVQALNHTDGPFDEEDEELLMAFGANAAAAIENANLYDDIERLFEGFVQASVTAIESRDPTTSGHSDRVAGLSVGLLEALPRSNSIYGTLSFSEAEMREMRYAALLHDFGKVGVREEVLLKAAKLYPYELAMLEARFEHARRSHQVRLLEKRIQAYENTAAADIEASQRALHAEWTQLDTELEAMLEFIKKCNRPSVLDTGGAEKLIDLSNITYRDCAGVERPLLLETEQRNLSIGRGSLNAEERLEIESHVTHTFAFLNQIPWTRDLARVPLFARGHHEKLDGTGYPSGSSAAEIPVQTRVMTIADIFDALTASDRPYKSAMPRTRALDILQAEAKRGKVDPALLDVFIEADVASTTLGLEKVT